MEDFRIVAIGQTVGDRVSYLLTKFGLKPVNLPKAGKFGNLTTLTFLVELEEDQVIQTRKEIASYFTNSDGALTCLYDRLDWMVMYVVNRYAFRSS